MEEILDQTFNENEKDETRINRLTAFIRLLYCVLLFCNIAYLQMTHIRDNRFDFSTNFITVIILNLVGIFLIYYNLKSVSHEFKSAFVVSIFKREISVIFVVLNLPLVLIYFFPNLITQTCVIDIWDYIYLFSGICLILILTREITYLKRRKNTKP